MEALPKSQSQPKVTFHNVASLYIPGTSVECHYSLAPHARWTSKDWIGIFKVRWSSVRDYHTFLWSPSPDGYAEGSPTNCSVRFQASYLPRSGPTLYQFCYVEFKGEVAGVSTPFTFSDPKPEEDFITLEDFENNSDMLVVMTKTSLLERQLEESDRTKESLVARQRHLEGEMQQLQGKIEELEQALEIAIAEQTRLNQETHSLEEEKQRVTTQHISLEQEHAQAIDRIQELEEDIQALSGTVLEKESELERMKERIKKLLLQREQQSTRLEEEAEEKGFYQSHSEASQLEVQRLQGEQQVLRNALADTDSLVTELRDEVEDLQQKASAAHELKGQVDILREQLRCTHDQLAASQQKVVLMGEEMGSASSTRDRTMSELHRSRLDVADLNIRLAEVTVKWKESKGQWLKEKAIFLQSSEAEKERVLKLSVELVKVKSSLQEQESEAENLRLELIRERDCSRVQLSELLRERKEMKSGFRVVEKEKEKLQEEKQELLEYVKVLEARLEQIPGPNDSDATYKEASAITEVADGAEDVECAPITPSEGRGRPRLSSYSLCDNTNSQDSLTFNTPPLSPQELNSQVVISQPMAISPQHNPAPHDSSSESVSTVPLTTPSSPLPTVEEALLCLQSSLSLTGECGHTVWRELYCVLFHSTDPQSAILPGICWNKLLIILTRLTVLCIRLLTPFVQMIPNGSELSLSLLAFSPQEDEEAGGVYSEATPSQSDGLNALLTELGHTLHFEVSSCRGLPPRSQHEALDRDQAEESTAASLWKECPICKQHFPSEYKNQALEDHIDSHFFFSTSDPFTFE
eukprot:gi/632981931/ref/XP_007907857.1/ PREDICTED: calcium-binding and coiled-coil domain-containing protein 1 [Callorhinchus milii]